MFSNNLASCVNLLARVLFDVSILEATLNKLEGSDIFLEQSSVKNECFWAENISKLSPYIYSII